MPEPEVDVLAKEWVELTARDLLVPLFVLMANAIEAKRQAITERMRTFPQPIRADDEKWLKLQEEAQAHAAVAGDIYKMPPDPSGIRRFIETCQLFSRDERAQFLADSKERLAELEYFLKHKRFGDPERWLREDPLSRAPKD